MLRSTKALCGGTHDQADVLCPIRLHPSSMGDPMRIIVDVVLATLSIAAILANIILLMTLGG